MTEKFKYKIKRISASTLESNFDIETRVPSIQELNGEGLMGWELVSILERDILGFICIFKKRI